LIWEWLVELLPLRAQRIVTLLLVIVALALLAGYLAMR